MIRLARPDIDDADIAAVVAALKSGMLVQGQHVRAFEECVRQETGAAHAVAVSNCTAALHLSLLALGVGPGDRVAVPAFSWLATANVVVLVGAEPVFVDIERDTFAMDPNRFGEVLRRRPPIKAAIVVHPLGVMADMASIVAVAERHGTLVLEDAACALGARMLDRPAGRWGAFGCFSFHPRKAVTTGEGGVVVTQDVSSARRIRVFRNHGLDPDAARPDFIDAGYNLRLTEMQGALGVQQMKKLRTVIEERRARAARYTTLLAGTGIGSPCEPAGRCHVFQTYAVMLPQKAAERRAGIIQTLADRGIETTIATHHMPLTTYFRRRGGYARGDFPVTDDIAERTLALPLHTQLTPEDQERVIRELRALV